MLTGKVKDCAELLLYYLAPAICLHVCVCVCVARGRGAAAGEIMSKLKSFSESSLMPPEFALC